MCVWGCVGMGEIPACTLPAPYSGGISMARTYNNHVSPGAIILGEVFNTGKSEGWSGPIEEREQLEVRLEPFGVIYTCDMRGTWEHRRRRDHD